MQSTVFSLSVNVGKEQPEFKIGFWSPVADVFCWSPLPAMFADAVAWSGWKVLSAPSPWQEPWAEHHLLLLQE